MKSVLSYVMLPLITLLYLVINLYMLKNNIVICESNGCSLTKTILKVEPEILYYISISVYIFILILSYINYKKLIFLIILNIFIFETYLIYKFFSITNEYCLICLGFYSLIILNLLMIIIMDIKKTLNGNKKVIKYILLFVLFNFIGFYILNKYILLEEQNKVNNIQIITKKYTILGTNECKFCKKLKDKLIKENIDFETRDYYDYENTLKLLGIKQIPVLIVKNNDNFEFVYGEDKINEKLLNNSNNFLNNLINYDNKDNFLKLDGCTINNTEKCD